MATILELPKAAPFLIEQDYSAYTTEQHAVWAELVRRRMPQLEQPRRAGVSRRLRVSLPAL